jgi:thioredoxin reductase (NADPH)
VLDYLKGQVPTAEGGCLAVDAEMGTAVPGVFAAGDLVCGAVQQAVVAAAQGATAALGADRLLAGRARLRKDYK